MDQLLAIEGLEKSFGGRRIVSDLSLYVGEGEIVGLIGPNGAGKTTAFTLITGLMAPERGSIRFAGVEVQGRPIHYRARLGMGYLAQEPSIFPDLTVEENLLCILELMALTKSERYARAEVLLKELDLSALARKRAGTLSGGERRRLEITRALIKQPKLLLLDEPFANVDPKTIGDVKRMIRDLAMRGISILITDHNAREIFSLVDRCYLMRGGTIFLSGSVEELLAHPAARSAYLGEDFQL